MGEPLFQILDLVMRNDVIVLSSNYIIYGEMSDVFINTSEYVSPENHEYTLLMKHFWSLLHTEVYII